MADPAPVPASLSWETLPRYSHQIGSPVFDGQFYRKVDVDALRAREGQTLVEWLMRYTQILAEADALLHKIRFASNAEELWKHVGMSQEVEDLHDAVLHEADAVAALLPEAPHV